MVFTVVVVLAGILTAVGSYTLLYWLRDYWERRRENG